MEASTYDQAIAQMKMGQQQNAYKLFIKTVREDATNFAAWMTLGDGLRQFGNAALSVRCYEKALAIQDEPFVRVQLGESLRQVQRFEDAKKHLLCAVERSPVLAKGWYCLALIYLIQGQHELANQANSRAIELEPHIPDLKWLRSLIALSQGNFAKGVEDFDQRLLLGYKNPPVRRPLWRGEDLRGKSIHLLSEQGYGDIIQFFRFVSGLMAEKIFISVPPALKRLFELNTTDERIEFIDSDHPAPWTDYELYLGSLLKVAAEQGISALPYLNAPSPAVDSNLQVGRPIGCKLAVGVCWAGNPNHQSDRLRSTTPDLFAEELALPGIELYSLQIGTSAPDPTLVGEMGLIRDLAPSIRDFADTAVLIKQLDCVVSVDTAIVHLCGALGVTCHVLLPYSALDWRWQHGRSDSPWYASLRLHRQAEGENWRDVLKRVAAELIHLV